MDKKKTIPISKALSRILRHSSHVTRPDGFVSLDIILNLRDIRKLNVGIDDIRVIVDNCPKGRFAILSDSDIFDAPKSEIGYWIRANQGHSHQTPVQSHVVHNKLLSSKDIPFAAHGSYLKYWNSIERNGLLTFSRKHIHFSPKVRTEYEKFIPAYDTIVPNLLHQKEDDNFLKGDESAKTKNDSTSGSERNADEGTTFIAGQRVDCDLFIFLDLDMCFRHKVEIFKSNNEVILLPGVSIEVAKEISKIEGVDYDPDFSEIPYIPGKRSSSKMNRSDVLSSNIYSTSSRNNESKGNPLSIKCAAFNMGVLPPILFRKVVNVLTGEVIYDRK